MMKDKKSDTTHSFDSILDFPKKEESFEQLRQLIFGLSKPELERLQAWLRQPGVFIEELSSQLPKAIRTFIESEEISIGSLIPLIEEALESSVSKNPQRIVDILFPVIIPAIRRAVAESISNMLSTLNETLEKSFSPKRYAWRIQALFSHKTYAEIVLAHAYVFQVRHVFLIHKETGLMLNQISDDTSFTQDGDMVSAMLTAIKDFVQDSLNVEGEKNLNTIQISGYNIWIEQGPHAIIAGIVEGNPPRETREIFKQAIEAIHLNYSFYLQRFEGDITPFISTEKELSPCLQKEEKIRKRRPPYLLILILIGSLGYLAYWGFFRIEKHYRWQNYKSSIKSIPGLIINHTDYQNGNYVIKGMLDPFGPDPNSKLAQFGFNEDKVNSNWIPYHSMVPQYILERATYYLKPPNSIQLSFTNGTLFVKGQASESWLAKTKLIYQTIFGIHSIDLSGVGDSVNEKIEFNTSAIEKHYFEFPYNIVELNNQQRVSFDSLIFEIKHIIELAKNNKQYAYIKVLSYTSYRGNPDGNKKIAYERALEFIKLMLEAGVQREILIPEVIFIEDQETFFNIRTVSFEVVLKHDKRK